MNKLIDSLISSRDQLTLQIMTARYDTGDMHLHDVLCKARDDMDSIIDRVKHDGTFPFHWDNSAKWIPAGSISI